MRPKYLSIPCALLCSVIAGYPQSPTNSVTLNSAPSTAVGQPAAVPVTAPESANPNLVEGRELFNPESVALDTSVTPPILYVSDSNNNRVLAWKNATSFANGQAADLVIGQDDQFSTNAGGPGTASTNPAASSGLYFPTGLAVYQGNLYVADTNNNRIIRYPHPFAQTGLPVQPDMVIGQPSVNAKLANYTGSVSAQGVSFAGNVPVSLAFDSNGNLWTTDPGNSRVLEFPKSAIAAGGNAIAATVELGQPNLTSTNPTQLNASTQNGQTYTNQFAVPLALGFDGSGNLFVSDTDPGNPANFSRVLVFVPAGGVFGTAASATRIMGILQASQLSTLTQSQILTIEGQTLIEFPAGLFFLPDSSVGVVDSGYNRILIFPPYSKWPAQATYYSPQASYVVGQSGFSIRGPNGTTSPTVATAPGTPPATSASLNFPVAAVYYSASNQLFVADTNNNRVLAYPLVSGSTFGNATAVLGQASMNTSSINLIEGKEFDFLSFTSSSTVADAGIALDSSGSVPHLYVADTYNNRVLAFYDARKIAPGAYATIVIGQKDFTTGLCNYPTGDTAIPTQSSLCQPTDVLVDSAGNLYVADRGNGRVLRFPAPFANYPTLPTLPEADLVLGQSSFTFSNQVVSQSTMGAPYGLAFSGANGLLVSDELFNRVLYIPFSANHTFAAGTDNGKAATKVFGQQNFTSKTAGNAPTQLNSPHHIAADTNGQLYVADTLNNRVPIFSDPNTAPTSGANPLITLSGNGVFNPVGLFVNSSTGEIWVANGNANTCIRFPKYETLQLNPVSNGTVYASQVTLAVLQDQYGDLFVADATNRISVYYQGLTAVNGASFLAYKNIAPGMAATINQSASPTQFGPSSLFATAPGFPLGTTLGNLQVLFNGTPAPMYFAGPAQINFQVPNAASNSGTANLEVVDATTGQVYGAGTVTMAQQSPGIFECGTRNNGLVQACVLNSDSSVNSTSNPAKRGSVISIYATGQGYIPNAPPDGTGATGITATVAAGSTRVFIAPTYVDEVTAGNPVCALQPGDPTNGQWILYSGLAPGYPGLWQINVQIPMCVAPASQVILIVSQNGDSDTDAQSGFHTTIAVK